MFLLKILIGMLHTTQGWFAKDIFVKNLIHLMILISHNIISVSSQKFPFFPGLPLFAQYIWFYKSTSSLGSHLLVSGLYLLAWRPLITSTLQQMESFHSSWWLNRAPLCINTISLIHLSVDGHQDWFNSLPVMNSAVINMDQK